VLQPPRGARNVRGRLPPSASDRPRPKHLAAGAEPPTWWASIDRRRAALAVGISMLALPVVLIDNRPDRSSAEAVEVTAAAVEATTTSEAAAPPRHVEAVRLVTAEPAPTTTTTVAPTTTAPPTTAPPTTAPPTTAPPTTAPRPSTTTTTAPPPPPPAPSNTESGGASWYRHGAGECAHKTLPMGTVVRVTNRANGATATCTVTDRGPYGAGRIIDLDASVFEQLAPLDAGVIQVTISW